MLVEFYLLIGLAGCIGIRRVMNGRSYSRFEDFLLGTLGAFFGDTLVTLYRTPSGIAETLIIASTSALILLLASGVFRKDDKLILTSLDNSRCEGIHPFTSRRRLGTAHRSFLKPIGSPKTLRPVPEEKFMSLQLNHEDVR